MYNKCRRKSCRSCLSEETTGSPARHRRLRLAVRAQTFSMPSACWRETNRHFYDIFFAECYQVAATDVNIHYVRQFGCVGRPTPKQTVPDSNNFEIKRRLIQSALSARPHVTRTFGNAAWFWTWFLLTRWNLDTDAITGFQTVQDLMIQNLANANKNLTHWTQTL